MSKKTYNCCFTIFISNKEGVQLAFCMKHFAAAKKVWTVCQFGELFRQIVNY